VNEVILKNLKFEKKGHVGIITLDRPEAGNAIDQQMAQELEDICLRINRDEEIFVAVVTGTGDRAFCIDGENGLLEVNYSPAGAVAAIECPVIAAINGEAIGQGLELALSCDIRIAADNARFGFINVTEGLIPTDGGTQRLPRIVGRGKALELLLTASIIDAGESLEIGLVSKLVSSERLMAEAGELAESIASKGPIALRYVKEAVNKGMDMTLEQGLRLEADLYFLLHTTDDRTEGIRAFREKRNARFKGQ
jgi:enoyl-CoA hydratase/carnithine racemase